jgi:hypothetical protein
VLNNTCLPWSIDLTYVFRLQIKGDEASHLASSIIHVQILYFQPSKQRNRRSWRPTLHDLCHAIVILGATLIDIALEECELTSSLMNLSFPSPCYRYPVINILILVRSIDRVCVLESFLGPLHTRAKDCDDVR